MNIKINRIKKYLVIFTLLFIACPFTSCKSEPEHSQIITLQFNAESIVQGKLYELNLKNTYEVVETENGADVIFHLKEVSK